jgi:hypothetical protein
MELTCWHVEDIRECGEPLALVDGRWTCPHGHPLRQYDDLSPWLRDHLQYRMGPGAPFRSRE